MKTKKKNCEKGMTLVEITMAIALLAVVSVGAFQGMVYGYKAIRKTEDITIDAFTVQKDVEQEIIKKRDEIVAGAADTVKFTVFGEEIEGHKISMDINGRVVTSHGTYTVFVPNLRVKSAVPEMESVEMYVYKGASKLSDKEVGIMELMTGDKVLKGSDKAVKEAETIKAYSWYITGEIPEGSGDDFKNDINNYTRFQEWNPAKGEQGFNDSGMIPNLEKDFDIFKLTDYIVGSATEEKLINTFGNRYIKYGVTPYTIKGKRGVEMYSEAIYIDKRPALKVSPEKLDFGSHKISETNEVYTVKCTLENFGSNVTAEVENLNLAGAKVTYTITGKTLEVKFGLAPGNAVVDTIYKFDLRIKDIDSNRSKVVEGAIRFTPGDLVITDPIDPEDPGVIINPNP